MQEVSVITVFSHVIIGNIPLSWTQQRSLGRAEARWRRCCLDCFYALVSLKRRNLEVNGQAVIDILFDFIWLIHSNNFSQ